MSGDDRCRWCGKVLLPVAPSATGEDGIAGELREIAKNIDAFDDAGMMGYQIRQLTSWSACLRALADRLATPTPPAPREKGCEA